jgi:hypothetical protein
MMGLYNFKISMYGFAKTEKCKENYTFLTCVSSLILTPRIGVSDFKARSIEL